MQDLSFPSPELTFAGVSAVFAIAALILATIFAFLRSTMNVSVKLLGSIMVLSLAFAANNAAVYALGIFIIATLVTDLDFLEKIAAIFWNRDKYWEYRLGSSSPSQVTAKVAREVEQELNEDIIIKSKAPDEDVPLTNSDDNNSSTSEEIIPPANTNVAEEKREIHAFEKNLAGKSKNYQQKLNDTIANALAFENAAQRALKMAAPYLGASGLRSNVAISTPNGHVEIDAIIITPSVDLVFEIKYSKRPHVLLNALSSLQRIIVAYGAYREQTGFAKRILPIAILPSTVSIKDNIREGVFVLRLDPETQEFTNIDDFRIFIEKYS